MSWKNASVGEHMCVSGGLVCDGQFWDCVDGRLYGPCERADCTGVCELNSDCECFCHAGEFIHE